MMKSLGQNPSDDELAEMIAEVDVDGEWLQEFTVYYCQGLYYMDYAGLEISINSRIAHCFYSK